MGRVWNPTEEVVSTMLQGAWFTIKPNMFKSMDEAKCNFIRANRKDTGLVILDDRFDPASDKYVEGFATTEEGKALLLASKEEGITNLVEHHMEIVKNNQVSLRNDLAQKNPAADPVRLAGLQASKGELESMRLVTKYKGRASDSPTRKLEEITKLMDQIGDLGV